VALAQDLPGGHGIQLVAVFQLGKFLLIAIERDVHGAARTALHAIDGNAAFLHALIDAMAVRSQ
jgi:hypothetical protein